MMAVLFLGVLIFGSVIGVPIAFALIASAAAVMSELDLFSVQTIGQQIVGGVNSFTLLAMPFFILSGEIMNESGISNRIVDFVSSLVAPISRMRRP